MKIQQLLQSKVYKLHVQNFYQNMQIIQTDINPFDVK